MKQFSTEDLILLAYNESPGATTAEVEAELAQNWALKEKNAVIHESIQLLQEGWQHPRQQSISRIIAYAKSKEATATA